MLKIKGFRTMGVNLILGLTYMLAWPTLTTWVDPWYIGEATVFLNLLLRWITTGPVGTKT